ILSILFVLFVIGAALNIDDNSQTTAAKQPQSQAKGILDGDFSVPNPITGSWNKSTCAAFAKALETCAIESNSKQMRQIIQVKSEIPNAIAQMSRGVRKRAVYEREECEKGIRRPDPNIETCIKGRLQRTLS